MKGREVTSQESEPWVEGLLFSFYGRIMGDRILYLFVICHSLMYFKSRVR